MRNSAKVTVTHNCLQSWVLACEVRLSHRQGKTLKFAPKPLTFDEYFADICALAQDGKTHFYFDTSFLIWLTGVGASARADFFEWMVELGPDRFHVPNWSTHEYYRHHVNRQASENIETTAKKLTKFLDEAYVELLPAFCEGNLAEQLPPQQFQIAARSAFRALITFSEFARKWANNAYDANSAEVIEKIINKRGLRSGNMFRYLETIGVLKDNRYSGRIPPGFKDKNKSDTDEIGGNSAGDLMFWKEILDHAKRLNWGPLRRVTNVIILTNDGKTDWVRGGRPNGDLSREKFSSIRSSWDPLPLVHPTLEYEISTISKVERVALLNSMYLGTIFLKNNVKQAFAMAAVATRLTGSEAGVSEHYDDSRKSNLPTTPVAAASGVSTMSALSGQIGSVATSAGKATAAGAAPARSTEVAGETSGVQAIRLHTLPTSADLAAALFLDPADKKRSADNEFEVLLSQTRPTDPLSAMLTREWILSLTLVQAAWLGRNCMERANENKPLANDHILDLVSAMPNMPTYQAAAVFAGVLTSVYFDVSGKVRDRPFSTFLDRIVSYETSAFARPGIEALKGLLAEKQCKPLYFPDVNGAKLLANAICTNTPGKSRLESFSIHGFDVLDNTCGDDALRLKTLISVAKGASTLDDVLKAACRIYSIPVDRIELSGNLVRQVYFLDTQGFIDPGKLNEGEDE